MKLNTPLSGHLLTIVTYDIFKDFNVNSKYPADRINFLTISQVFFLFFAYDRFYLIFGMRCILISVKISASSLLVVENSETTAPSGPP